MSQLHSLQVVAWVFLAGFYQIYSKNQQLGQLCMPIPVPGGPSKQQHPTPAELSSAGVHTRPQIPALLPRLVCRDPDPHHHHRPLLARVPGV